MLSFVFAYGNPSSSPWRRYAPLALLVGMSLLLGYSVRAGFLSPRNLGLPPGKEDGDVKYVGIKNLSNTCYLNSVLQSLYFCKPFRESVLAAAFKKKSVGQELKAVFQKLADGEKATSKAAVKPFGLVATMDVDVDVQQDAEEFFLSLLNAVEESLDLDESTAGNKQAVLAVSPARHFRFRMRQRIRCVEHAHDNDKELSQLDLSLDISRSGSLSEALAQHFAPEILRGENRYRCSQHGLQEAEKSLRLCSLPDCLAVHLQRFSFDSATGQMRKIGSPLAPPLTMDLADYLLDSAGQSSSFELAAMLIHEGTLQAGHYVAVVRDQTEGSDGKGQVGNEGVELEARSNWLVLNDAEVFRADEEAVLSIAKGVPIEASNPRLQKLLKSMEASATAYLLLYRKVEKRTCQESGEKTSCMQSTD